MFFIFVSISCQDSHDPKEEICEEEDSVSTRFYDIVVSTTDASGNVANKTCSVAVIPEGHYKDDKYSKSSSKSLKSGHRVLEETYDDNEGYVERSLEYKKPYSVPFKHDWNDLRDEYAHSTSRYVIDSLNVTWDPNLDTQLVVPPLPPVDKHHSSKGGKGKGRGNEGKGMGKGMGKGSMSKTSDDGMSKSKDGSNSKTSDNGKRIDSNVWWSERM